MARPLVEACKKNCILDTLLDDRSARPWKELEYEVSKSRCSITSSPKAKLLCDCWSGASNIIFESNAHFLCVFCMQPQDMQQLSWPLG